MCDVFNRVEKKYILNKTQFNKIKNIIYKNIKLDPYHTKEYTISSIYLDTDNFDLIRKSMEKPIYKEKVRLRSYGVPNLSDEVFLEIKKKYNGYGNKRRIKIKLKEAYEFINGKIKINSQIGKELDYTIKRNVLKPKIYIAYDRIAFQEKEFRITLDYNIRYRIEDIELEKGDSGNLLGKDLYIMEAKALNAYPKWFIKLLSQEKIYPKSFSKYGNIYKKLKQERKI